MCRHPALNLVGGKCSTADADCLKKTRDQKLYQRWAKKWEDCCTQHVGMNPESAERIIELLDEFGPAYYEVAHLTGALPDPCKPPVLSAADPFLLQTGEAIPLVPENSARPRSTDSRLDELEKRCNQLLDEFSELSRECGGTRNRLILGALLARTRSAMARMSVELGV